VVAGGSGDKWVAEQDVTEQLAARLVARQFPELARDPVRLLGTGWDNTVHLVGERWAFRFPRRAIALPGIERERRTLARLATLDPPLPVPVPEPAFEGVPDDGFGWPFWGGSLLPGTELADAGVPDGDRVALGRDVGRFLAALHAPETAAAAGDGLPVDPLGRSDPRRRVAMLRDEWLGRLSATGLWEPGPAALRLMADAERLGPSSAEPVLCHGDLHVRHLLVEHRAGEMRAAGVIDWGDVCLADPAVDLSLAYGAFAGPARTELLAAYGRPLDPETEVRARTLALFLCAALASYAVAEDRPALLTETLAGLHRATA
jgi:aminoglycoside phosphotransferase (APT) family kinase protein